VVTHLFGDGDLDAGYHKVKASAAKESIARKTRTIASGNAQGTYWNRIKCKEHFGNSLGAVIRQATINLDAQIWKSPEDSLPEMHCAGLCHTRKYKLDALCKQERYNRQLPYGCLHQMPLEKCGNGKSTRY
jgi:hypothetical protein